MLSRTATLEREEVGAGTDVSFEGGFGFDVDRSVVVEKLEDGDSGISPLFCLPLDSLRAGLWCDELLSMYEDVSL